MLQFANIICAELLTPHPDGFVSYEDAAFRQKILDVSQAEAETMVGPDRRVEKRSQVVENTLEPRSFFHEVAPPEGRRGHN